MLHWVLDMIFCGLTPYASYKMIPSHWESECPKMATIYGGGQVTITAPAAVDSESGFLEPPILRKASAFLRTPISKA